MAITSEFDVAIFPVFVTARSMNENPTLYSLQGLLLLFTTVVITRRKNNYVSLVRLYDSIEVSVGIFFIVG